MQHLEGKIVKNLIKNEPAKIVKITAMGSCFSVEFIGKNSSQSNKRLLTKEQFETLEVVSTEGSFQFNGNPEKFKAYAEAERINSAYQFDPLFAVNCSIVDPLPHQIEAVYKYLLPLPNIRFLLADDTGAGKTIMTGLLIKELILRSLVERILIITPGGLTKQWQEEEMGLKFNLSFKLVNREIFKAEPNIFSSSNLLVTSIDFIRAEDVTNILREVSWDLIVVDEAHKLSAFDYGVKKYKSKRYEVLEILAKKTEHLLLLTATPHRGRTDTFRNLLQLLDEDIFANDNLVTSRIQEVSKTGVNRFFIRRLKEQMKDWNQKPLFKQRFTKTVAYELTPEERKLYEEVTKYLTKQRGEAIKKENIHVSLALLVMQRRLTSSIYAIKKTLYNRYVALRDLVEEVKKVPSLLQKKQNMVFDCDSLDEYDELDDKEKDSLEGILADPRKFRFFTTANSKEELEEEKSRVKILYEMAEALYSKKQEEAKFVKLRELLKESDVLQNNEKLVIFTEHKDTLFYLEQRLKNSGFLVGTIHGGMSVDERRQAQFDFANENQILIATDAAGEGINLQFCRFLINWDIPWNPNRLEQRMGRIHRYGQLEDVMVFNMVAHNTREGKVLSVLLDKVDKIREQIGSDKVYDVIDTIFEGISLEEIISATFDGVSSSYENVIQTELNVEKVKAKINEEQESMICSEIDYDTAALLKEKSDEKRLQPIYVERFFQKAFALLGGKYSQLGNDIFKIETLPEKLSERLKSDYNISADITKMLMCFDKSVFLKFKSNIKNSGSLHYINPGNPFFDCLLKIVMAEFKEEMLKGTILVDPEAEKDNFAYFVKSQIVDSRHSCKSENIADERLALICVEGSKCYETSPAKFIDLQSPKAFTKEIEPPEPVENKKVEDWYTENITLKQFEDAQNRINQDIETRKKYLEQAFEIVIGGFLESINELHGKMLLGDTKINEKLANLEKRLEETRQKKNARLSKLDLMKELSPKPPEVIGCAYVVPLTSLEYKNHFGMTRDTEIEKIAMKFAMDYEIANNREPVDVSSANAGYDIRSKCPDGTRMYIEVKGRAGKNGVMLSDNEWNRLAQLGDSAWLYIVSNCADKPELKRIQDPANNMEFIQKFKGVQYYLPLEEWEGKAK